MLELLLINRNESLGEVGDGLGPKEVLGNIGNDYYFGPVDASYNFPSGRQVSSLGGVTDGELMFDTDLVWLKFILDGTVIFVARNNVRSSVSWSLLSSKSLVTGKTVTWNGSTLLLRLMKGDIVNPSSRTANYWSSNNDPTEWGRTLRRVAATNIYGSGVWDNFNGAQLNFHDLIGGGSWTQESSTDVTKAMIRGVPKNDTIYRGKTESLYRNWRPVLEWVG